MRLKQPSFPTVLPEGWFQLPTLPETDNEPLCLSLEPREEETMLGAIMRAGLWEQVLQGYIRFERSNKC